MYVIVHFIELTLPTYDFALILHDWGRGMVIRGLVVCLQSSGLKCAHSEDFLKNLAFKLTELNRQRYNHSYAIIQFITFMILALKIYKNATFNQTLIWYSMTMEVDLDHDLMNSFKTMNTTDRDVLINEFLRVTIIIKI